MPADLATVPTVTQNSLFLPQHLKSMWVLNLDSKLMVKSRVQLTRKNDDMACANKVNQKKNDRMRLANENDNSWQTHTRLMALCPGLPGWAGTRKAKPMWILLKQETVSGSSISWAIYKSAYRSSQHPTTHSICDTVHNKLENRLLSIKHRGQISQITIPTNSNP